MDRPDILPFIHPWGGQEGVWGGREEGGGATCCSRHMLKPSRPTNKGGKRFCFLFFLTSQELHT